MHINHMKKFIHLILVLFTPLLINAQEIDCKSVKEGRFKIIDKENKTVTYITRKNNYQTEKKGTNEPIDFHVIWKSECIYQLRPTKETIDKIKCPSNMVLNVEILKVSEYSYLSRSSSNFYEHTTDLEIIRID